jgi:predicted N-acetyltransferase YhbS
MNFQLLNKSNQDKVTELFRSVFTSSEGESEGNLIGNLASKLSLGIDNQNIFCFGAYKMELLVGSIFFTRLTFQQTIQIFMLAPVAVRTDYQGRHIGQTLINYGLEQMKIHSVAAVVTYGDPRFYAKVGFQPISQDRIQPPQKLSMPQGWLALSLTQDPIPNISEKPQTVEAFNDPAYW